MKLGHKIKKKGRNTVLEIWPPKCGTFQMFLNSGMFEVFLKSAAHLLSKVLDLSEFFFRFAPSDAVIEKCVSRELCRVTHCDKKLMLVRPTSPDNMAEMLNRLMVSGRLGADAFAPATPGYIPRPRRLFSGGLRSWFKPYLSRLKWFCIFELEYPLVRLWAKTAPSNPCDRLAEELQIQNLK